MFWNKRLFRNKKCSKQVTCRITSHLFWNSILLRNISIIRTTRRCPARILSSWAIQFWIPFNQTPFGWHWRSYSLNTWVSGCVMRRTDICIGFHVSVLRLSETDVNLTVNKQVHMIPLWRPCSPIFTTNAVIASSTELSHSKGISCHFQCLVGWVLHSWPAGRHWRLCNKGVQTRNRLPQFLNKKWDFRADDSAEIN
jgi:hypothetical protein